MGVVKACMPLDFGGGGNKRKKNEEKHLPLDKPFVTEIKTLTWSPVSLHGHNPVFSSLVLDSDNFWLSFNLFWLLQINRLCSSTKGEGGK